MYSGGLDTTAAALVLAQDFKRVHLVTFCNGFCIRVSRSKLHFKQLQAKFGADKIIHEIIDAQGIFSQIKTGLMEYIGKYRSPLVFDLCCRLAMETALIIYCLRNNISYVADGNSLAQDQIFLQQAEYMRAVDQFFQDYTIQSIHPVMDYEERSRRIKRIGDSGFSKGHEWLEKYLGIGSQLFNQPFCLWAPVPFFFTSGLRKLPFINKFNLPLEKALEFRKEREAVARECIRDCLEKDKLVKK